MTDPLRPFAEMIRALWLARTQPAAKSAKLPKPPADPGAGRAVRSLRSQIKARIPAGGAGASRMRDAFVEAVLLWELGEQPALDPAFGELVRSVSEQLGSDPEISERLHRALSRLVEEPSR